MSKQIAVRLPDDLVSFLDKRVAEGVHASRASILTRELQRLRRRMLAEQDAEIYRRDGEDPDLVELISRSSRLPMDID